MDIILLERIENVGSIGDRVNVKSGYARNYLIPQGKATLATAENIKKFDAIRAELEKKEAAEVAEAETRATALRKLDIRIKAQAGPEGKLFGSVGTVDIADACVAAGVEIERSEVRMPDGPLRSVGEHTVDFHLHSDVNVELTVVVEAEGGDYVAPVLDDSYDADDSDADEDSDY